MIYNKKLIKIEKFTNLISTDETFKMKINNVFRETLARNANDFEIEDLKTKMKDEYDIETIIESISKTEEYKERIQLNKTIEKNIGAINQDYIDKTLDGMKLKERMNIYRSVIEIYTRTLDRLPNINELNYYSYRLTETKGFDKNTLESILLSSTERNMIEKNQTNLVNVSLNGKMTEAEIKYYVIEVYKTVLNTKDPPNELLCKFLQTKFIDYQMDKVKLSDLILLLNMVDKNQLGAFDEKTLNKIDVKNIEDGSLLEAGTGVGGGLGSMGGGVGTGGVGTGGVGTGGVGTGVGSGLVSGEEGGVGAVLVSGEEGGVGGGNSCKELGEFKKDLLSYLETLKKELKNSTVQKCDQSYSDNTTASELYATCKIKNSDPFYESLQCINNGSFDLKKQEDELSNYQYNRNQNTMKNNCKRNKEFLNADDDMILFPEYKWSVPQRRPPVCYFDNNKNVNPIIDQTALIGTLLEDAKQTSVGSIMPKFVYKEDVQMK